MNAKQQYREAYRVARDLRSIYKTLAEQLDFIYLFNWNFDAEMYIDAYLSLKNR